jgi:predicted Zn-dependent peptidase
MGLLLDDLLWPEEPLGRDIAGSRESVEGLSRDALLHYLGAQYVPGNVVLSVAGDLSRDEVIEQVSSLVDRWQPGSFGSWQPAGDGHAGPRVAFRKKQTEQAQIGFGYPAYSAYHPDRHALDVLNVIVGDGMSSRLFVEVRENRGLAYSVNSHVARYLDTGAFGVSAAVAPGQVDETIRTILQVLREVRSTSVSDDELDKAKSYISGRFLLRMEDSRAVASWVGGQELLKGEVQSVDAVLEEIGAVGQDDVLRVAQDVIRDDRVHLAVVGPYRSEKRFRKLMVS